MLTIGQLAAYAGVTVRAVRHYHATGLLPEPERDHSGYRRYDATAVADLIKIRTLAEAGVPLSRVRELLAVDGVEFAAAVDDIDRQLRAEIRQRQRHRERIVRLVAGDSLALPAEAVAYLGRLRELGFTDRFIGGERDAWILVAAQLPERMPLYMTMKQQQLDDPESLALYRDLAETIDWEPTDPRLPAIGDRLVAQLEAAYPARSQEKSDPTKDMPDDLARLLDELFLELVPAAPRFLELLRERGWTGWTNFKRSARTP
ncbi:MerR family transcriptional regulator [Leekyejoonella antrihumi]|uniref:MerR family transcriptional regulator n=1 Tax=Leekyejoonella antrihumi TaxID=1660198 RepID=A0A563E479_9MICO|nr:MerR family transcriptional regulator [Leekyejoonella antrihumi]TWP37011.1 MerR family transcriptional regulator [Leekyejoonella antrihumi]